MVAADGSSSSSSSNNNNSKAAGKSRNKGDLHLPRFTPFDQQEHDHDAEEPSTPNFAETARSLRRSLSVTGLQELAQLPRGELRRSVGQKIWRPQHERARVPKDWDRLAVHVVRGGIRAAVLAFGLRATVTLVFALIKGLRTKRMAGKDIMAALFGETNFRFAAMFGVWAALYKAVHNALRLATAKPHLVAGSNKSKPESVSQEALEARERSEKAAGSGSRDSSPNGSDEEPLTMGSGATTPTQFKHLPEEQRARLLAQQKKRVFMRDPRSKVWHAYLAGAISALAILCERKENRISLAQQLIVRGMEGTYNVAHGHGLINIPHGAIITFGLACGQIMYAWINVPDSLPRSYTSWITKASHVAPPVTKIQRTITHANAPVATDVLQYFPDGKIPAPISTSPLRYPNVPPNPINRRGITGKNVARIVDYMRRTDGGEVGQFAPCALVHPWEHSHFWSPVDRFLEVTRWILPVYMTLHFVPAIFLRSKSFLKDPLRVFLRSLFGSVRSSSFLGIFVIIFQTWFCALHSMASVIDRNPTLAAYAPQWFRRFLVSQASYWVGGFLTSLSLLLEHSRRRAELAMYVLPKGMESAWSVARQRAWVPFVPGGDLLLTSAGMSLVMGTYAQAPEHLSGLVRRIVYQFVGHN